MNNFLEMIYGVWMIHESRVTFTVHPNTHSPAFLQTVNFVFRGYAIYTN